MTKKANNSDDKQFVAGLQSPTNPSCYKDFFNTDNLAEAKTMAVNSAQREKRKTIVFDRNSPEGIVFRCDYSDGIPPQELPPKKGRKKK